ncbi:hypothetical protein ALQ30_200111 [Pseudomonas syringae pv. persicae]|uniref:Uncharacterized protein n=1 Tax=Pseudomonas syringae pv. persicae TaxID=237306 RepID=A0A3M4B5H9_9PSED|nr:hypothetical protein ALQ30_200111 [Pseudomonas syringae pv. persicae]
MGDSVNVVKPQTGRYQARYQVGDAGTHQAQIEHQNKQRICDGNGGRRRQQGPHRLFAEACTAQYLHA